MTNTNDSDDIRSYLKKVHQPKHQRRLKMGPKDFFEMASMQRFSAGILFVSLLIFLLVGLPATALSKTLKRSCKGAEMMQYEIGGKKYTLTEPFRFTATGTSKGAVPSPNRARDRACKSAAQQAASAANRDRLLNKVCAKHKNDSGRILFMGGIARSQGVQKTHNSYASPTAFRCQSGRL